MSDFKLVKELRQKTGLSLKDCVEAIKASGGDLEAAQLWLREKGKRGYSINRSAKEGRIGSYIHHNGRIGVLLEVNCETDFTARNEEFKQFIQDVAIHIASSNPQYLSRDDVPEGLVAREKAFITKQAKESGKPEKLIESKIIPGRLNQFFSEICLLDQPFVKEPKLKIKDLLTTLAAKVGETIIVKRFVRFELGQE